MTIETILNSHMSVAYITDCATSPVELRHQSCIVSLQCTCTKSVSGKNGDCGFGGGGGITSCPITFFSSLCKEQIRSEFKISVFRFCSSRFLFLPLMGGGGG
jgi:hypothetical protein